MKKFKKLGSILLAAVMALSLSVPAFAADITTDNSAGTVPVIVTTPEGGDLLFKVTLPTSFDIAVDKNGAVKTTDGLKVTNASAGAVDIKNVEITGSNEWALADFDGNFGKYGVGQKVIGMEINGCKTSTTGLAFASSQFVNDQDEAYMWAGIGNGITMPEHNTIALTYDARLPGQNVAVSDTVAKVVFTAGWYVADGASEGPVHSEPVYAILYADGLVFQEGNTPKDGKTAFATYANVETSGFSVDFVYIRDIDTVTFDCKVQPTTTAGWFANFRNLTTINGMENLDTSKVTSMDSMFYNCNALTSLDISSWDTRNVTNMDSMFENSGLTTIYASDSFVTTAVTSSDRMFSDCYSLVGGNSTAFDSTHTDKEYARIDAAGTPGYFTDVNALPVSAVLYDNGELVFQKGSAPKAGMTVTATYDYEDIEGSTDVKPWSSVSSDITTVTFDCGIQPTSTSRWFAGFSNLTTVNGMENLDTSNLTDTREMFSWCSKLSSLDLSSWTPDTTYGSQCNMQGMFIQCNITLHVSEAQYDNWTPMTGYLTEDAGSITFVKA